ncbi:MAG: hypothetical protein M9958_10240 [Chitinophagales bacterium]|nr:hypothetical protein [Chitinophagales bacterium]
MMKNTIQIINDKKIAILSFILCLLFTTYAFGQQNVNVNVIVMQPMSPYLPQLVNEIQYGQLGTDGSTLKDKIIINLHNLSQDQKQVKLSAKLERLSPTYGSISLNPNYQPSQPILMAPNQMMRVDRAMVDAAFGGFSKRELIFDNFDYSSLKQNALNYKLPEGMYRLCVTAYDFNDIGQTIPLGSGCATFNICYSASAPQFTMPFSSIMLQGREFGVLTPLSNQIQFAWMAPSTTCGFPLGFITYDFEIREIYPGQSINDARNNVYVFRKNNIPTNLFILDTLLYRNVLILGKSYIVKVKAVTQYNPNNPLEIQNQGYSEIIAFKYQPNNTNSPIISGGTVPTIPLNPQTPTIQLPSSPPTTGLPGINIPPSPTPLPITDPEPETIATPPGITLTPTSGSIPDMPINCGLPSIENTTPYSGVLNNGDIVKVGEFDMKILNASKSGNTFKGTGEIIWSPYSRPIMMNVKYEDIKINSDKKVISGNVVTTSAIEDINMINVSVPEFLNQVGNLKDKADNIVNKANSTLKPLNQLTGNTPVDFPLGLNNVNIAGTKSTLAIMGIVFTPKGADARMLFTMKIPGAGAGNEWLSLAGAGFCIHPDAFSVADGILYLPNDRSIDMGGGVAFKLRGGVLGDSSNVSYVKWNSTDGFERVFIKASVTLPEDVKPVDALGNITAGQVSLDTRFDFKEWEKWIANLNTDSKFSIEGLPGFVIDPKGGIFYDHSVEANPANLTWPTDAPDVKFVGKEGNTYKGFYMKDLEMSLPKDFAGSSSSTLPTINIKNLFINSDNGLWADISANKLLDFGKGDLGGWLFSIDKIDIPIKKWIPRGANMSGIIALPISEDTLSYSCGLNTVEGYINYNFNVSTVGNYKIPMWIADATLGAGTSIQIVKENDAKLKVGADLNLILSIDISNKPKVVLNAVDIQGMQIANYNMKESNVAKQKIGEFYFCSGDIKFATLARSSGKDNGTGMQFFEEENDNFLYARGPYPSPDGGSSSSGSSSQDNTVCGFGFEPKSFSPKVSTKDGHFAVGLQFGVGLRLGTDAIQLNGETDFTVWGVMGGTTMKPTAKGSYPLVELDKVSIDGNFGKAISATATLYFKNDEEWGEGVIGDGMVTFPMGIEISATVVFGSKADFKYFGFGASLYMQTGLFPIGPLVVNGFGGGYYQNLEITTGDTSNWNRPFSFKPKKDKIAFNVSLDLSYIRAEMVKANAGFTLQLNSSGGFDKILINGWANIISDGKQKSKGIVNAELKLEFAQDNFDMYVGANIKMFVSEADIPIWVHVGKDKEDYQYWLYLGYPAKEGSTEGAMGTAYRRIAVTFININTGILKVYLGAQAYFCAGTKLPQFPPLPPDVEKFLGGAKSGSMGKVLSDIGGGQSGFMFGASVNGNIRLQMGIFYAKATAKIGFDVAFRYFTKSPCGGATDMNERADYPTDFGMNGWYANGQIYLFFSMDVGFILDLWFWSGEVSLVKLAIGAALEAGLPNPTWMDGRIKIEGEVLGGLIRVNTSARFSLGTKCSAGGDPLANIEMISEFGPAEKDVSIFANPYATYSIPMSNKQPDNPIEVEFQVPKTVNGKEVLDDNDMPVIVTRIYKFIVEDAQLLKYANNDKKSTSTKVGGIEVQYSDNGYASSFINKGLNALEEKSLYGAFIKGRAFEKIGSKWVNPKEHPKGFTQDSTIYFTTGKAPRVIDEYAVVNSYPMKGQNFLLKNEFNRKGKILLYQYTNSYFTFEDATVPELKLTFVEKNTGARINTSFKADPSQHITFDIPSNLKNETVYQMYFTVEDKNYAKGMIEKIKIADKDLRVNSGRVDLSIGGALGFYNETNLSKDMPIVPGSSEQITYHQLGSNPNIDFSKPGSSTVITLPQSGVNSNVIAPTNSSNSSLTIDTKGYKATNPYSSSNSSSSTSTTTISGLKDNAYIVATPNTIKDAVDIIDNTVVSEDGDTLALIGHTTEVFQPESGRIIYSSIFKTSKYNSFQDKMASLGDKLNAAEKSSDDFSALLYYDIKNDPDKDKTLQKEWKGASIYDVEIPIFNTGELFDEFEVKGMKRKVGYDKSHLFDYTIPPLLKINPNKYQTDYTLYAYASPRLSSSDEYYSIPMYSITNTLVDSSFLKISFSNPYIRGLKFDSQTSKMLSTTYSTPSDPYKMSNEGVYYTLLNDEGVSVPAGGIINSGISFNIIDKSPSIVAIDLYLLKLAEENYAKGRKELKSYYDQVDFTSLLYLSNSNYLKFKDLIVKPSMKRIATYQDGFIDVNIQDNKVGFDDKTRYAQRFWLGKEGHKLMESVRLLDYKVNKSYDNEIYISYGHDGLGDLRQYNSGNNKDQYGNIKLGFDFTNYSLFPTNGPMIKKKVEMISSSAMKEKKEFIKNTGTMMGSGVTINLPPATNSGTGNSGSSTTVQPNLSGVNITNTNANPNVIYNQPSQPITWPPIVGRK